MKLLEIGFSSSHGNLQMSDEELIENSKVVGTIGTRKVSLFQSGENKVYFFANNTKVGALVYLFETRIMAMKNFSQNKGLIYNLFQYLINIEKQKVTLQPIDILTTDGINWILGQIKRGGFTITDLDGKPVDADELYKEWITAHETNQHGPTGIIISESKNANFILENEQRVMPMDIFGATLPTIDKISERVFGYE